MMPSYLSLPYRRSVARIRPPRRAAGSQDLRDPALVDAEGRQCGGDLVGHARRCGHAELVVAQDPDRDVVDPQRPARLVDDGAEELLAVVRLGETLGDPEDAVEALGELGFETGAAVGRGVVCGVTDERVRDRKQLAEHGRSSRRGTPFGARTSNDAGADTRGHRDHGPIGVRGGTLARGTGTACWRS